MFYLYIRNCLGISILAAGCVDPGFDDVAVDTETAAIETMNGLTVVGSGHSELERLMFNAVSTHGDASNTLIAKPLASATFTTGGVGASALLIEQLRDPYAQTLMRYVVGCALSANQSVTYSDEDEQGAPTSMTWTGELGLCPDWSTGAPDTECQERVSACIAARVNAFGERVPITLRGERDGASLLPVSGALVGHTPATLASAAACPSSPAPLNPSRNCGWHVGNIGTCTPNTNVTVMASSCQGTMVRVCAGIDACDSTSLSHVTTLVFPLAVCQPSTFTCPGDGAFTIMTTSAAGLAAPPSVTVSVASPALYPASEPDVYPWQEGAFWGNLFGSENINPTVEVRVEGHDVVYEWNTTMGGGLIHHPLVVGRDLAHDDFLNLSGYRGTVYSRLYACWSPIWTAEDAYASRRVCAGPNAERCAAEPVGNCGTPLQGNPSPPGYLVNACSYVSPYGRYDLCNVADSSTGDWPLTVYLHHHCDIVHDYCDVVKP